ncbi:MAG: HNH endonuclease [Mogibacterium sp.]|nr:HNH endonuclease [Mogibacterium sp.]MBR0380304.1 HNH endonuclease [Mogibacterium sp.]
MPRKPDKPCSYPGCPRLVPAGQSFCPEHMKQMNQTYERYGRDPAVRRHYGKQWRKIRSIYIKAHPYCQLCYETRGIMVKAEQVHHIKPLSEGGTNDFDNLMSLCKSCHSRIHAERGDRWGNKNAVKD